MVTARSPLTFSLSLSLSFSLFLSSSAPVIFAALLDTIQCPKRTHDNKSLLVGQNWPVHVKESIENYRLWLLQQCSACLVHITCMVCLIGGKWPYSCCFVGFCFQNLFEIARNILSRSNQTFSPRVSLYFKWCNHRHGYSSEEIPFYFIRETRFSYDWQPVNNNPRLP